MSLLPFLFDDFYRRPSRLLDQHFGLSLDTDDLFQPIVSPRMWLRCPAGYLRNWQSPLALQDTGSTVQYTKDKFEANLDVQQFKPEEISVKVTPDNTVTIEGKHEEKQDEHGYISRHFVRRYVVPKNCDLSRLDSRLSSDGVLTITAPRTEVEMVEEKTIPIQQTGEPAKQIEAKK